MENQILENSNLTGDTLNNLLVFYVDCRHCGDSEESLYDYMNLWNKQVENLKLNLRGYQHIMIPAFSETRVECINPKYITNQELIDKHTSLMTELELHLSHQLKQLTSKDNEEK